MLRLQPGGPIVLAFNDHKRSTMLVDGSREVRRLAPSSPSSHRAGTGVKAKPESYC